MVRRALVRARVHEPARFFGYGIGLSPLLLCLLVAAIVNDAWLAAAVVAAPLCVFWFAAIECIRLSVYCEANHITGVMDAVVRSKSMPDIGQPMSTP